MKRRIFPIVEDTYFPAYVVWELTLECDQRCLHCGSRAASARENEMSVERAVELCGELALAGAKEVILIGGEAYLHPGFLDVVRALGEQGIRVGVTTGGRGVDLALARQMAAAGVEHASVSVDGLRVAHRRIRNNMLSFDRALGALNALKESGIAISANTHVNRLNRHDLEGLYALLRSHGIRSWQIQLTAALGRAADHPEMLLQPYELLEVVPLIAALKQRAYRDGIRIMPGNNLGYFGPEEALLRSVAPDGQEHWRGCQAGKYVLGIESDGGIKGCPSLQSETYRSARTLRTESLASLWQDANVAFNRTRGRESLWGFCASCPFAETCRGGCTFTAHALFGKPGNNPYCHYRVRALHKQGLRERIVPKTMSSGLPFDHRIFDLELEATDVPSLEVG
ncbi:MAG: radical SAM protein [Myxococcota bacterium]